LGCNGPEFRRERGNGIQGLDQRRALGYVLLVHCLDWHWLNKGAGEGARLRLLLHICSFYLRGGDEIAAAAFQALELLADF
jgi:hypothetical protein